MSEPPLDMVGDVELAVGGMVGVGADESKGTVVRDDRAALLYM